MTIDEAINHLQTHSTTNGSGMTTDKQHEEAKRITIEALTNANQMIDEIIRQQRELTERTLAEIVTKYDFIVGSIECKHRLMEVLPEGANIVCSPYLEDPTMIYAIKKFDIADLIKPYKAESEVKDDNCAGNDQNA